jgi:hypothetical protein
VIKVGQIYLENSEYLRPLGLLLLMFKAQRQVRLRRDAVELI